MHLIVGLGNPGSEYDQTRHNSGFMAVDRFLKRRGGAWKREAKFQARLARVELAGQPLVLAEPLTYMNQSGFAVQALAQFYKVSVGEMVVVVDDADLPLGTIRMRPGGSSGGHHGLESIEQQLGTRDFARLRIGIGRRSDGEREITGYVLGRFTEEEGPLLDASLERVCDQLECWIGHGVGQAMNQFNGTISTPQVNES